MTGTTISQAIPIALSPILTRIYTPSEFGVFALYISIVSVIAIIVTARYEMAIVLPKKDEDAINILALSLLIMLAIVFTTTIIIILFKDNILNILNAKEIGNLLYLLPISLLFAGLFQSFNYWNNRKEYFRSISTSAIYQSSTTGGLQLILGYINNTSGLIIGFIVGRVVGTFVLINKFMKYDNLYINNVNKEQILILMKKYKDFPLINSFHAFSDTIRTSGTPILISSFFGTTILGFYALSLRVLQTPILVIGSALGQVLYQKFSELHNDNIEIYPYLRKIILYLILIALPIFTILYYTSPFLFSFIFGEEWRIAGEYSQILVPYIFVNFLTNPISQIAIIVNKQKEFFFIALVGNIALPLIIVIGYLTQLDIKDILSIITYFFTIYLILMLLWFIKISKITKNQ